MIGDKVMKCSVFLTLISFIWLCGLGHFSFAHPEEESSPLDKAMVEKKQAEEPIIGEEKIQNKSEKKVIPRSGDKKKKNKLPWWLVAGGVLAAGLMLYFVIKTISDIGSNYDTTVLGIEWVDIPEGEFVMGDSYHAGYPEESPAHTVYLDRYQISKYEVTFDQYDRFCDDTNLVKPGDVGWGRGDRPVINVSWNNAKAFCDWLSAKTGKNIHLPTEAQWEKAARGTDQRTYPWGNTDPDCSILNFIHCNEKIVPVGSYPAGISPYGVHDMAGNVWEMCADWYEDTYYLFSPYKNPTGPESPPFGMLKVERGGGWMADAHSVHCTSRSHITVDSPYRAIGFRLCKE